MRKYLSKLSVPPFWLATIEGIRRLQGRPIFNRQSTLRLLTECACVSDPHSTFTLERADARNNLAKCYLIANSMLDEGNSSSNTTSEEEFCKQMIADSIPTIEYAINTSLSYRTKLLMVRSADFCAASLKLRKHAWVLTRTKLSCRLQD